MAVKIEGMEEVAEAIQELGNAADIEEALKKVCMLIERAAKQNAPKGNGELRRSIQSKINKTDDDIEGIVYTPLLYAPYVEFGTGLFAEEGGRQDVPWRYKDDKGEWHSTRGMKPQPYLRPAFNDNREEILRIIRGSKND